MPVKNVVQAHTTVIQSLQQRRVTIIVDMNEINVDVNDKGAATLVMIPSNWDVNKPISSAPLFPKASTTTFPAAARSGQFTS